jgi:thiol-disulfide isomerase/thioredoxin
MKIITFVLLLLTFLLPVKAVIADSPPKFWIKNMEGKRFNSKKHKSAFVVSFFFVNCVPCIKEIPVLHKFMSTNYPDVPLLFIDPIREDSKNDIKKLSVQFSTTPPLFKKSTCSLKKQSGDCFT